MSDVKCRLVKNIPAALAEDTLAIVTLPDVPKENAVLKVHQGNVISYYRVRAIAYDARNDAGLPFQEEIVAPYLLVVTVVNRADLLEPFPDAG
jgi:hypothetical protein